MNDIIDYLEHMVRKDAAKGRSDEWSNGVRTTREVADYFGLTMPTARRRLNALYDAGKIEGYDGEGNSTLWLAKSPTPDALKGDAKP